MPLIQTLTAVGADWLAFELIEGIRRGREVEETSDSLAISREQVRQGGPPMPVEAPNGSIFEPQPILGDEQIEWATAYIIERLDMALAKLAASIDNLDMIVDGSAATPPIKTDGGTKELLVVFSAGEDQPKVDRAAANQARDAVPGLRAALEAWSIQVRGTP
jgi:hypothetical protein